MLGNSRETANVSKENGDGLINAAKLERLRILEHLFHHILGEEPAVVCAGHFLTGKTFVRPRVLNRDCCLRGDGAD